MRFTYHVSFSSLIGDDQPGAAVATIYAKLRCESQLSARRAMERVNVSGVCIIPEMIFYEYLHSDLSFWHAGIIRQRRPAFRSFLVSSFWFALRPV
jgi:hypothetical protein